MGSFCGWKSWRNKQSRCCKRRRVYKDFKTKIWHSSIQLQKDKNKVCEKLGLLVYEKTIESNVSNFTGDVEYFSFIEKINRYSIEISEKDEEIISIKKEYGIDDRDIEENLQSSRIIPTEEEE